MIFDLGALRFRQLDRALGASQDLRVGTILQIYGRHIFITDCDPFTRPISQRS